MNLNLIRRGLSVLCLIICILWLCDCIWFHSGMLWCKLLFQIQCICIFDEYSQHNFTGGIIVIVKPQPIKQLTPWSILCKYNLNYGFTTTISPCESDSDYIWYMLMKFLMSTTRLGKIIRSLTGIIVHWQEITIDE